MHNIRNTGWKRLTLLAVVLCAAAWLSGCGALLGYGLGRAVSAKETVHYYTVAPTASAEQTIQVTPVETETADTAATTDAAQTPEPTVAANAYTDIRTLHGSQNLRAEVPVSWQRGKNLIQSVIGAPDSDTVTWDAVYQSQTLETQTDVNDDGTPEQLGIQLDSNGEPVDLTVNGMDVLDLLSPAFTDALKPMMNADGSFMKDAMLQASSMDLDGDGVKELIVACGNDSDVLAVAVMRFTGSGYAEAGGIIGSRLLIVTETGTIYLPVGNSSLGKYAEFRYAGGALALVGYNMD